LVSVLWLPEDCFEECFSSVLSTRVVDFIFVSKSLTCHGYSLRLRFWNANAPTKINFYHLSSECYQICRAFFVALPWSMSSWEYPGTLFR
jgi:hypothetical protein